MLCCHQRNDQYRAPMGREHGLVASICYGYEGKTRVNSLSLETGIGLGRGKLMAVMPA